MSPCCLEHQDWGDRDSSLTRRKSSAAFPPIKPRGIAERSDTNGKERGFLFLVLLLADT